MRECGMLTFIDEITLIICQSAQSELYLKVEWLIRQAINSK